MNLLLDTHAVIWFINGDNKLSRTAQTEIGNAGSNNYISVVSLWEIAIKISIGKLKIKGSFEALRAQISTNNFTLLSVTLDHIEKVSTLEFHHRDPFDRLLIAQAIAENMSIVSNEKSFDAYKVKRIW